MVLPNPFFCRSRIAEMRVAETIRALRKAYGVGICSVEEICAVAAPIQSQRQGRNLPRQPANGNYSGAKVRDRLGQINPPPPSRSRRAAATAQTSPGITYFVFSFCRANKRRINCGPSFL